jgi:hypothetical protein
MRFLQLSVLPQPTTSTSNNDGKGSPPKQKQLSASHAFAVFMALVGMIRVHCAYLCVYILWYNLVITAEALNLWYLLAEWLSRRNAKWSWQLAEPLLVSVVTLMWMFWQKEAYVENKCVVEGGRLGRCGDGMNVRVTSAS